MNTQKKEAYVSPEVVKHELLRDITGTKSNCRTDNYSFGGFGGFGRFGGWGR
jgi:hypothetical protein